MGEKKKEAISEFAERVLGQSRLRLVPIARVLEGVGKQVSQRLVPEEYREICSLLGEGGIGIEPDPECTGVHPRRGEQVVLFRLDGETRDPVSAEFLSAAAVLALAVGVAQADNEVVDQEEQTLEEHLEDSLELCENERVRLRAWLYWLIAARPRKHLSLLEAKETLRALPVTDRRAIAAFVVRVAAADEVVNLKEIDFLKKAFSTLELSDEDLELMLRDNGEAYVFNPEARSVSQFDTSSASSQAGALIGILFGDSTP